ncbi:MAG: protein translocase subunit SecF [Actinomycetales bacterium]
MASRFAAFGNDLYSGKRSYNFVGNWRRWLAIAGITVLVSIGIIAVRGLNPSIEFRGGSQFQVSGLSNPDQSIATQVVQDAVPGAEAPRVSVLGGNAIQVQTERLSDEETNTLRDDLAAAYDVSASNVTSSYVGASWGSDVTRKALTGLGIFLVLVSIVITGYFRAWQMAVAAVLALLHDLAATAGIYALTGFEVSPASVIGFLTILGYSLYDTVVVFDKVRENTAHIFSSTKRTYAEAVNLAVNQTLVRSINTSVVALLPVGAILFIGAFLLGAGTLKDISLALFVGMIAGTYSSIFLAPPLLVLLRSRDPRVVEQAAAVARARAKSARSQPEKEKVTVVASGSSGGSSSTSDSAESPDAVGDVDLPRPRGPRNQPRRVPRSRRR